LLLLSAAPYQFDDVLAGVFSRLDDMMAVGCETAQLAQTAQQDAPKGVAKPQVPLEVGPLTVLGERSSLVDPVVVELAKLFDEHGAASFDESELEVEVRLGIIVDVRKKRVDIPCSTESVVRATEGFAPRFVPGLPTEAFAAFTRRLDVMCSEKTPAKERIECGRRVSHTVDKLYKCKQEGATKETQPVIRVTEEVPQQQDGSEEAAPKAEPRVTIKRKLGHVDIYTGRKCPEHGPTFDLRAALSKEEEVDGFELGPMHVLSCQREKVRKTYHFRAWKIDVSNVTTTSFDYHRKDAQSSWNKDEEMTHTKKQTHEVELELDSYPLKRNLDAKAAGQNHVLWELLTDFLDVARDLAVLAAELRPFLLPPTMPELPAVEKAGYTGEAAEAAANAFRKHYGKDIPEPIIGHYLYRVATEMEDPPSDPQKLAIETLATAAASSRLPADAEKTDAAPQRLTAAALQAHTQNERNVEQHSEQSVPSRR